MFLSCLLLLLLLPRFVGSSAGSTCLLPSRAPIFRGRRRLIWKLCGRRRLLRSPVWAHFEELPLAEAFGRKRTPTKGGGDVEEMHNKYSKDYSPRRRSSDGRTESAPILQKMRRTRTPPRWSLRMLPEHPPELLEQHSREHVSEQLSRDGRQERPKFSHFGPTLAKHGRYWSTHMTALCQESAARRPPSSAHIRPIRATAGRSGPYWATTGHILSRFGHRWPNFGRLRLNSGHMLA